MLCNVGDRRASRVCFDSLQRSVKPSVTSSSSNATGISLPQLSSPAGDRLGLSPEKIVRHGLQPMSHHSQNSAHASADLLFTARAAAEVQPVQAEAVSRVDLPVKAKGVEGASGDSQNMTLHPYLIELVRNTVRDEVEECEERIHRTILHVHADMLRQFHFQQVVTHFLPIFAVKFCSSLCKFSFSS